MQREDIKSYKDACKCIGRKPRQYKDAHMNTYEQLTTVIAALNFIANNNKPWQHELHKGIPHWYIWYSTAGFLTVNFSYGLSDSSANVGTQLRLKERDNADYLRKNFTDLLFDWFRK